MSKVFDIKQYDEIIQQLNTADVEGFHRSFDFLKEITLKLLTNLLILNGGAVVVTLTFVGALIDSPNAILVSSFINPLLCFAIGSVLSVFLCGITYFSQVFFTTASSLKVNINENYRFLFLNQQKREFYTRSLESGCEEEYKIIQNIINSLDKTDEKYEKMVEKLTNEFKCKTCQGNICQGFAVILFVLNLMLFLYGVYLMGNIFSAFN